ncbi:MAG: DNRLRE domain-containing protein, partial [Rhizobiales bacterium]|nr:DNRLRE domain-containing protein [Hyphomicrobiales bacterium]
MATTEMSRGSTYLNRRSIAWLFGLLLCLSPLLSGFGGAALAAQSPVITVRPTSARVGDAVVVRGSRFAPNARLSLSLDGNASVAHADADSLGSFFVSVTVPQLHAGTHVLTGLATNPIDGSVEHASAALTILAAVQTPIAALAAAASTGETVHTSSLTSQSSMAPTQTTPGTETAIGASVILAASSGTFNAEADARVEEAHPNTNYGLSPTLGVDGDPNARIQSYVRFTVSGISGHIQSAVLRLHVTSNGGSDGPWVLPANNNWKESAITWATSPPTWSHPISDLGAIPANSWVSFDVTPLVTKSGQYTFKLVASAVDGIEFSSRESLQPPQLLINETASADPTQTPATQSPTPSATRATSPTDMETSASSPPSGQTDATLNPFAGAVFFVDPLSAAMVQATAWR